MNPGWIWWNQIGSSLRFVERIAEHMQDTRPVILHLPENLPWQEMFDQAVDRRRVGFCESRSLRRIPARPGQEPGMTVLEELCSREVRADYWPGQSVGEYLAAREDLVLNDYYVWVTGIRTPGELLRWTEFLTDYEHHCGGRTNRAVFLLEYSGSGQIQTCVSRLCYRVEEHDCRVFCLELAAALDNSGQRAWQAELTLALGGADPERCAALLETGEALLRRPEETAAQLLNDQSGDAIASAVWKAELLLLFPVLEKFRMAFIAAHRDRLLGALPLQNSGGERITDPRELELGSLYYIAARQIRDLGEDEERNLRLFRRVRNLLAHNHTVPYEDACAVLEWNREN